MCGMYALMCGPVLMIGYACLPHLQKLELRPQQCVAYYSMYQVDESRRCSTKHAQSAKESVFPCAECLIYVR